MLTPSLTFATGKPDSPVHFVAVSSTHNSVLLKWRLDFTGGYKMADIGFKIRQKKDGAENFVYRDIPKVRMSTSIFI